MLPSMAEGQNRILMCPPDYFAVQYEINPWMNVRVAVDHNLACQQWQNLYQTIAQICPNIGLLIPRPGLPDLVFCDAGFLYKNVFIPSCFRYPERQPEAEVFADWFAQNGYEIRRIAPTYYFEGHGDTLWVDAGVVYCGYGFRSQKSTFEHIRHCLADVGEFGMKLVRLTDPRFYHLDTCFTPLNRNLALIYQPAVDDDSFRMLAQDFELLTVTEADALAFACNSIVLGQHLIMPAASPALQDRLQTKGFQVHIVPVGEFMKAGGACKCLAMPLLAGCG